MPRPRIGLSRKIKDILRKIAHDVERLTQLPAVSVYSTLWCNFRNDESLNTLWGETIPILSLRKSTPRHLISMCDGQLKVLTIAALSDGFFAHQDGK